MKSALIFSFLLSFNIIAQETLPEKNGENQQVVEIKKTKEKSSSSRVDKKFEISAGLGFNYSNIGVGLNFGYFIAPNQILELEVFRGEDIDEDYDYDEEISYENETEKVSAVSVNLKLFVGPTFYLRPGLFYSNYKYNDIISRNTSYESAIDFQRKDLGLSFQIGNQWQISNFIIGVDWFGVQYGVKNLSKSGRTISYISSRADNVWLSATLLKLNLGASF